MVHDAFRNVLLRVGAGTPDARACEPVEKQLAAASPPPSPRQGKRMRASSRVPPPPPAQQQQKKKKKQVAATSSQPNPRLGKPTHTAAQSGEIPSERFAFGEELNSMLLNLDDNGDDDDFYAEAILTYKEGGMRKAAPLYLVKYRGHAPRAAVAAAAAAKDRSRTRAGVRTDTDSCRYGYGESTWEPEKSIKQWSRADSIDADIQSLRAEFEAHERAGAGARARYGILAATFEDGVLREMQAQGVNVKAMLGPCGLVSRSAVVTQRSSTARTREDTGPIACATPQNKSLLKEPRATAQGRVKAVWCSKCGNNTNHRVQGNGRLRCCPCNCRQSKACIKRRREHSAA
jgi:hypothetical protein